MFVGLFVLAIIGSVISDKVHDEMSPEEFAKLFPMIRTKEVEYDIVPIETSRIQKRDVREGITHVTMKAFGEDIKLWLNPVDGILATADTPVYSLKKDFNIAKHPHFMKKAIAQLYEDEKQGASITMNKLSNGHIQLNGMIGAHNIYIRPVPNNNVQYVKRHSRSIDNIPKFGNYTYHIAYKMPEVPDHLKFINAASINPLRSKRSIVPDTIYPEIMVIMDYPLFKLLQKCPVESIKYILSFWNGVDLKYRSLQNPNYRLNIAGIIIATHPRALLYMQTYMNSDPYELNIDAALKLSAYWTAGLEKLIQNNDFDVAITMTSEIFCSVQGKVCERGTVGMAFLGGACSRLKEGMLENGNALNRRPNTGIIQDKASFEGIDTAVHELAHLLGVAHDGVINKECDNEVGNLMSPTAKYTTNSSEWSICSIRDFDHFLSQRDAVCLFNKPKSGNALPRFLPGKLMGADEQCKRREGGKAYNKGEEICTKLRCEAGEWIISGPAAVDGTPCGHGKMCLHGQCLYESQITDEDNNVYN